eukprot:2414-Heterococcus_DN1.PRE.1
MRLDEIKPMADARSQGFNQLLFDSHQSLKFWCTHLQFKTHHCTQLSEHNTYKMKAQGNCTDHELSFSKRALTQSAIRARTAIAACAASDYCCCCYCSAVAATRL